MESVLPLKRNKTVHGVVGKYTLYFCKSRYMTNKTNGHFLFVCLKSLNSPSPQEDILIPHFPSLGRSLRPIFRLGTCTRLKLEFTVYAGLMMFNHLTVHDFVEKILESWIGVTQVTDFVLKLQIVFRKWSFPERWYLQIIRQQKIRWYLLLLFFLFAFKMSVAEWTLWLHVHETRNLHNNLCVCVRAFVRVRAYVCRGCCSINERSKTDTGEWAVPLRLWRCKIIWFESQHNKTN